MEYRRLGKTGLLISAVALGGHWKGLDPVLGRPFQGSGYDDSDFDNIRAADFLQNRDDVVSRAIELGINYIDACSPPEVLAYSRVLRGRRGQVYLGYSWHTREPRCPEWRTAAKLLRGLEEGFQEAGLDYADLWRISLPADGIEDPDERLRIEEATVEALDLAKQQGKARFTGVSSHDRQWLRMMIERYPKQIEVVLFPFTGASKPASRETIRGHSGLAETDRSIPDCGRRVPGIVSRPPATTGGLLEANATGMIGIKPFGGGALFQGDGCDDVRARLALRSILGNAALASTAAGMASVAQVENAVRAIGEPREIGPAERAELDRLWRAAPEWLRAWEHV
jgi:aryl-alcohol dehydrogenase-like predicted oxidoreductase